MPNENLMLVMPKIDKYGVSGVGGVGSLLKHPRARECMLEITYPTYPRTTTKFIISSFSR